MTANGENRRWANHQRPSSHARSRPGTGRRARWTGRSAAVLAQLAHVDAGAGAVGVSVDGEIDHRVQDHELEELEVGDPFLDVATEVAGADDLPRATGQFDHHRRGRQEQVVELAEPRRLTTSA